MRDDDAHAHVEQSTELHTSELREDISKRNQVAYEGVRSGATTQARGSHKTQTEAPEIRLS